MEYSQEAIRRYLVRYHHLTDDTALPRENIPAFVRRVGCIQYDPLEPAGRNHDLVLQARCKDYQKGDLAPLLYEERRLFDVWDKCMSICAVEDWPCFARFRAKHLDWCEEHNEAIAEISAHLRAKGSACSSDFPLEDKVDWHYGPQRLAKAALEAMCYAGLAVVHHKKGTRRYYALAEEHIPAALLEAPCPHASNEEYFRWYVLRRVNSVGALWNRASDAFLGNRMLQAERDRAFASLLQEGRLTQLAVRDFPYPLYIDSRNEGLLRESAARPLPSQAVRFIAPLDNLIWDRRFIEALFGFSYKWEVYNKAEDRRYGYYVLPMLLGDTFIGRIEFATEGETTIVKEYWPEKGHKNRHKRALNAGIKAFARYNRCSVIR